MNIEVFKDNERIIKSGELYNSMDPRLFELQWSLNDLTYEYNMTRPSDRIRRLELLNEIFLDIGDGCVLEAPLHASWGINTHIGNNVYANYNLTLIDDTDIWIGNDVLIGPNVSLVTAGHPLEYDKRCFGLQFNKPIYIGDGVWIGANVTVLPGVHIGARSVIGAGSVVSRDIPEDVVAYGVPCRVQKRIGN